MKATLRQLTIFLLSSVVVLSPSSAAAPPTSTPPAAPPTQTLPPSLPTPTPPGEEATSTQILLSTVFAADAVPRPSAILALTEVSLPPDASITSQEPCPECAAAVQADVVEAGRCGVSVDGPAEISLAGPALGGSDATPLAQNEETILGTGDAVMYPESWKVASSIRNAGDEYAVFYRLGIYPTSPPALMPEEAQVVGDIHVAVLGFVSADKWIMPNGPISIQLMRVHIAPGDEFVLSDESVVDVSFVETGTVELSLAQGDFTAIPAGRIGQASPATSGEATLEANDSAAVFSGAGVTIRNPGGDTASILVLTLDEVAAS